MELKYYKQIILFCIITINQLCFGNISNIEYDDFSVFNTRELLEYRDGVLADYTIFIQTEGQYHLYFWTLNPKDINGNIVYYKVEINNRTSDLQIGSKSDGWHFSSLKNDPSVELNHGENHIKIFSKGSIYPEVDGIVVTSKSYDNVDKVYNERFLLETDDEKFSINGKDLNESSNSLDDFSVKNNPPYDYCFKKATEGSYCFFTTLNLSSNKEIDVRLTNVSDMSKLYIIQVFYSMNPEVFSICSLPDNLPSVRFTAPKLGKYIVKVRPYELNEVATASVSISEYISGSVISKNTFNNVPISSNGIYAEIPTNETYNSFTTGSIGDPMLWIEGKTTSDDNISGNIVLAFNDNGPTADFNWSLESKIEETLKIPSSHILLSAKYSLNPTVISDLYYQVKSYKEPENSINYINSTDLMESAPASDKYNCLSWVCGVSDDYIWPFSHSNKSDETNNDFENILSLKAFDDILGTPQYSGAATYTREGATEENAAINLWTNGNVITHFSIKHGADNNHHGFDWESKLGSYKRIFHPEKNVLLSYGTIACKYRVLTPATNSCLQEAVANGNDIIEYIDFSDDEYAIINSYIKSIPENNILKFDKLFVQWEAIWSNSSQSNPHRLIACQEYINLREFLNTHPDCLYLLYIKIAENKPCTYPLFMDLILKSDYELLQNYKNSLPKRNLSNISIYRPLHTVMTSYIKNRILNPNLLKFRKNNQASSSGVTYSNENDIKIATNHRIANISVSLTSISNIEIQLINCERRIVKHLADKQYMPGDNLFSIEVPSKGVYVVAVYINKKLNAKKIFIK